MARWPLRVALHDDELLSSYLTRAAIHHRLGPTVFAALWWPDLAIWNRDLDRGEDTRCLARIAETAGLDLEQVVEATLTEPRHRFGLAGGTTPLILSAGIYHRTRTGFGIQICPRCFERAPYLERTWRYSFVLACPRCQTPLQDACPHCDAPIIPHRSQIWRLDACQACNRFLTDRVAPAVPDAVVRLQTQLVARLHRQPEATLGPWNDDAMFAGLRSLITVARHPDALPSLRATLGLDTAPLAAGLGRFETLRIRDRAVILETLAHWLDDWPNTFFVAAGTAGLTQRTFAKVAQPDGLADEIARLPEGFTRDRTYIPLLQDPAIKRLRRRDPNGYRRVRGARLLDATTPRP